MNQTTGTRCPECGRPLHDEPKYCPSCGRRLWGEVTHRVARMDGYAVASVVCAVAGLFALPVVGPILGIVFGKKALRNIAADPTLDGAGLAQAGIIVGWVGLVVSLVVVVLFLGAFTALFTASSSNGVTEVVPVEAWPTR